MTSLPRAARFVLWTNAWLRGQATPDDVFEALGRGLNHVFIGLDDQRTLGPAEALGVLRSHGAMHLALPAPGDPIGLAGPPSFNAAALESGSAALCPAAGIGLIPTRVGGAVEWHAHPAARPPFLDPRTSRQHLQQVLREVTEDLVRREIATWNNDIPDLLLNAADPPVLPRDLPASEARALATAALCGAILEAASNVEPGALNAAARAGFEASMRRLDSAARHAISALCSAEIALTSDSLGEP